MSFRRPATLFSLCLIVVAERFAACLLGALLIFHLAQHHHLRPGAAAQVQAVFLSLIYGFCILGGFLADRVVGYRRALAFALLLLGIGYTLLAVPRPLTLVWGLGMLVLGQALLKPTVAAVLGALYHHKPELRAAGFAWFYVAINVAAAIAPWIAAVLKKWASWSGAMVVAAWSVSIGLGILVWVVAELPEPRKVQVDRKPVAAEVAPIGPAQARWFELGQLLMVVLCFTIAYSQAEGTLLFFARDRLVRSIKGYELPAEGFAALPAMLVLILKPVLDVFLRAGATRGHTLRGPTQLTVGMLLTAAAFVLLSIVTFIRPLAKLSPAWLIGAEILLTMAELLVMPAAMARVAELSTHEHAALSQGLLFGVQAIGFFFSGMVGSLWEQMPEAWFFGLVAAVPLVPLFSCQVARYWLSKRRTQP